MAVQLAKKNKVDTLILQSTFTDADKARSDGVGGYIPGKLAKMFGLLGFDDFNSEKDIVDVNANKIIILHGSEDTVVPCKHSEDLYKALPASSKEKIFTKLLGSSHGNYIDFYEKAELYDPSGDSKKNKVNLNLWDTLNEYILGSKKA